MIRCNDKVKKKKKMKKKMKTHGIYCFFFSDF
jgi:hypothetical protein